MTVRELRRLLEGVPDDLPVLRSGHDHSYLEFDNAGVVTAELLAGRYFEYYDDENMMGGRKIQGFHLE